MNCIMADNIDPQLLKVLVIEDDFVFNAFYKNFLQLKGVQVTSCLTLAAARSLIQQDSFDFDIIILDNQLTDGEGITLLPELNQLKTVASVIMASGNDDPEFFLNAYNAGIHDYIVKPVNLELMWIKILNAVSQRRLKQLSDEQRLKLEEWVESEQHQQNLARHLFDSMFYDLNQKNKAIFAWVKSHDLFSGDAILRCQGADGSWYFLLADAMGHGLAPAVSLMPMLQKFQQLSLKAMPLSNIVFEVNEVLNRLLPDDRFVAAILLRINPWKNEVEIWNGGMPSLICLNANGQITTTVKSSHMAMGILNSAQVSINLRTLSLADVGYIYFHSDGLTETKLLDNTYLQPESIPNLLSFQSDKPIKNVINLFNHVDPQDDISFCFIDVKALLQQHDHNLVLHPQTGGFEAEFSLRGSALMQSDLPSRVIDLLKAQNVPLTALQRLFTVLTELFVNALEHGVLQLDSELKAEPEGFLKYYEEKERRMQLIDERHFVCIRLNWSARNNKLTAQIKDSGVGFVKLHTLDVKNLNPYGRGLSLVRQLTHQFEIIPPGNSYEFVMMLQDKLSKESCYPIS